MTHSWLIVGGTKKKRQQKAHDVVAQFTARPQFDTTILEPEEDRQEIGISQVRNLQHQLSLKPYAAKFKTGIILEAQRMTVEAQNALLKTLEEPPSHSVLILTAPSTKNLLPTIASRCQIMRLRSEVDLDIKSEEHQQAAREFLELLRQGRGERLAWIETNSSNLKSPTSNLHLLDIWLSVLRDLLLASANCQSLTLNSLTSSDSFKPFTPFKPFGTTALTKSLDLTIKTKNLLAKTNVSPRLALEVLLLDLPLLRGPFEGLPLVKG